MNQSYTNLLYCSYLICYFHFQYDNHDDGLSETGYLKIKQNGKIR